MFFVEFQVLFQKMLNFMLCIKKQVIFRSKLNIFAIKYLRKAVMYGIIDLNILIYLRIFVFERI